MDMDLYMLRILLLIKMYFVHVMINTNYHYDIYRLHIVRKTVQTTRINKIYLQFDSETTKSVACGECKTIYKCNQIKL